MKEKKYNYTYIIYINDEKSDYYGCVYYGKHSTNDLLDNYITSGVLINKIIQENPNCYYRKILNFYPSVNELNKAEYRLIHPHLGKPYCLNLCEGGKVSPMKGRHHTEETKEKCRIASLGNTSHLGYKHSTETRKLMGEKRKAAYWAKTEEERKAEYDSRRGKRSWNKGKSLSEEYRHNMSLGHTREIKQEELDKRSKSMIGKNKGKHKVWDNKELNIYHMEY